MSKVLVIILSIILSVAAVVGGAFATLSSADMQSLTEKLEQAMSVANESSVSVLNVTSTEGGSINITSGEYTKGDVVELVASASEGYTFAGWFNHRGVNVASTAEYSFTISKDTALEAKFVKSDSGEKDPLVEAFDALYQGYSEKNAEIQKELLSNIITSNLGSLGSNAAVAGVVEDLTDKMLDYVKELKEENGEDSDAPVELPKEESQALSALTGLATQVASSKGETLPSASTITNAVSSIDESEVVKEVAINALNNPQLTEGAKKAAENLAPEEKKAYEDMISDLKASGTDPALISGIQAMLGLN